MRLTVPRWQVMSLTLVVALGCALPAPGKTPPLPVPVPEPFPPPVPVPAPAPAAPIAGAARQRATQILVPVGATPPLVAPGVPLQPMDFDIRGRIDLTPPVQPEFAFQDMKKSETGRAIFRRQWDQPESAPPYDLGVSLEDVIVTNKGSAPFQAVRITWVRPGSAAATAGLKPGDVLVWANNQHIISCSVLQDAIARSGGTLHFSVIHAGTWRYTALAPIQLKPSAPSLPNAPAMAPAPALGPPPPPPQATFRQPESIHRYSWGGSTVLPTAMIERVPHGETPSTSYTFSIPSFPWLPPKYSSSMVVPDNLVHKPGTDESLFVVAQRLENGFRSAGYGQLSYYAVPKGFAMATRLEQFAPDGTSLPVPDRWSRDVVPPKVFSLKSYFMALFGANPGHFRVIVLVVTSEAVKPDTKATVTDEIASLWPTEGANRLPSSYKSIRYVDDDYSCTALIYEFEQGAADDPPVLKNPGLDAKNHLEKANFFKELGQ